MAERLGPEFLRDPDAFEQEVLAAWRREDLLHAVAEARRDAPPFVFYEGPPTANGKPGIHHVLARSIKDAVCRFRTMQGFRVERKAGWDTHGLPVELEVEKRLGISGKPEIEELGIGAFNRACRESVLDYQEEWERLSERIGYLLDYEHPYLTCAPDYVETVWYLIRRFAERGLLYEGHKVLPWCGRCGTGLSSHEVGQGYRDLDDPGVWVSFPLRAPDDHPAAALLGGAALVAWTTTPWTLPSNFAAAVHPEAEYGVFATPRGKLVLLGSAAQKLFGDEAELLGTVRGAELEGLPYEPLFPPGAGRPLGDGTRRHEVVADAFVATDEGTGVVHLAPYGADDHRVALERGLAMELVVGEEGRTLCPLPGVEPGTFFRDANPALVRDLRERGRLLHREQLRHSYPHCWRCDTPLLYFPAPAWFLRTTAYRDLMLEENERLVRGEEDDPRRRTPPVPMVGWVPKEIGRGRFGEWLENNVDWALSRDRYWGTPLPVWRCDADPEHWECVGSFAELGERVGGLPDDFDPHRPAVDALTWACPEEGCSGAMRRVPQVVDCWFDSGAMPYAQHHWPFENRARTADQFPADFIAEGVDQTRGWFYTLHAIGVFLTRVDSEHWNDPALWGGAPPPPPGSAFRSCLVNGLLLDAEGRKMSKRLGNVVRPWEAIAVHGVDAIRWSLLSASGVHQPRRWDDRHIEEVRRRYFGTLLACHDFLALYAETEGWSPADRGEAPPPEERTALDRWVLARTARLADESARAWEQLKPHEALRALEHFVVEELSNWYVRRSRRRFWGEDPTAPAAFATLWEVLDALARMTAPAAPFVADALWRRLDSGARAEASVHLAPWPGAEDDPAGVAPGLADRVGGEALERAMAPVLAAAGLGRAVRERARLRVRQPLSRMVVHVADLPALVAAGADPRAFSDELADELNVKAIEWVEGAPDFVTLRAKPDWPRLGKRAGKRMKALAAAIGALPPAEVLALQAGGEVAVEADGERFVLGPEDVRVETESVAGLEAATDGRVTVGLDPELTPELVAEGLAREVLNRVQNLRKDLGFAVGDRIRLAIRATGDVAQAVRAHGDWIAEEALAPGGVECVEGAPVAGEGWRVVALPGGREVALRLIRRDGEPAAC